MDQFSLSRLGDSFIQDWVIVGRTEKETVKLTELVRSRIKKIKLASSPLGVNESEEIPGGIDFNPRNLSIQSQGNKVEMPISNNPQQFQNIEIKGLIPFIFKITPITDIPLILGESEDISNSLDLSRSN